MIESIDDHFVRVLSTWPGTDSCAAPRPPLSGQPHADATVLLEYTEAQMASRHLDIAARRLQGENQAFYTIGSSGHESNAAVAMALRPTDPALLHYRSGGFYCARAAQVPGIDPVVDVLRSLMTSVDDPISGGRHKVFGHAGLSIIPQTSTISSHLPRAVGMAFALDRRRAAKVRSDWPEDAVVVASLGDASVNHSTAAGALNAAGHLAHQKVPLPLLVVVEDNGIGISVRSPKGWITSVLRDLPGFEYMAADGADPSGTLAAARDAVTIVRESRRPVVLHLGTVRLMGHAGSDAELAYRSRREITADYASDPLLASARELVQRGILTAGQVLGRYEDMRARVTRSGSDLHPVGRLSTAADVMAPLTERRPGEAHDDALVAAADRAAVFRGALPESGKRLTLAQSLNAAFTDLMAARSNVIAFGEDVAAKGGVYGVTRGLRKRFGVSRVFDTLLDEQTVLGTALGSALAGFLPVPEIQYLAYLHNAEDQIRGEGATLRFFSAGQYQNGMIVRVAGLAYQAGFGGHFHNDNSVAVLRDIPGLILAVPSSAAEAPGMVRTLAGLAVAEGRVCVLLEPIALYHQRHLHDDDNALTSPYQPPEAWQEKTPHLGEVALHGDGEDVLVVTFGNGVRMSRRALSQVVVRASGQRRPPPKGTVMDLRWLSPLPTDQLLTHAARFTRVLVVDETRRSGGVAESIISALVEGGYPGKISRVCSEDSLVPLGPAAATVLLSEDDIVNALLLEESIAPQSSDALVTS